MAAATRYLYFATILSAMKCLLLPALALLLCFVSCKNTGTPAESRAGTALHENELFDKTKVAAFLQDGKPNTDSANKLFMQGVDAYRNRKDEKTAASRFVESICYAPTPKAYYELGNVRADLKDYPGAIAAYNMAEQLGFEPLSRLLYNKSCALSLGGNAVEAVNYMQYAVEAGYTNSNQLLKDPDLQNARNTPVFAAAYKDAMAGAAEPEVLEWQTFKREFSAAQLPLTIDAGTVPFKDETNPPVISYEYERFVPQMRGAQFSREVSKEFFYYTRIAEGPRYTALIYVIRNSIMGDNAPYAYILATYDGRGALIDKLSVAGSEDIGAPLLAATIQPNLQVDLSLYKQQYEKDPEENGYYDNKIISTTLTGKKRYHISDDGMIVRDQKLIGLR